MVRWGGDERDDNWALTGAGIILALAAFFVGRWTGEPEMPEPKVVTPKINLETEALVDATTIEMRGYDESGKPGEFLYDCEHDGKRLVCTQREGVR